MSRFELFAIDPATFASHCQRLRKVFEFVLSFFSYLVDYLHVEGYLRWFLILLFMMLKAGLIVAVFMHMVWERLALVYAILVPTIAVMVFIALMALESDYTLVTRHAFFAPAGEITGHVQ